MWKGRFDPVMRAGYDEAADRACLGGESHRKLFSVQGLPPALRAREETALCGKQGPLPHALSSEYGAYYTVKARFWSWLSGKAVIQSRVAAEANHIRSTAHRARLGGESWRELCESDLLSAQAVSGSHQVDRTK
jgi:hypothetical protein